MSRTLPSHCKKRGQSGCDARRGHGIVGAVFRRCAPMVDQSLAFSSALRLAELVRTRQVSPVELVDLFLGRIALLNPKLNAYLTVGVDQARAGARENGR